MSDMHSSRRPPTSLCMPTSDELHMPKRRKQSAHIPVSPISSGDALSHYRCTLAPLALHLRACEHGKA